MTLHLITMEALCETYGWLPSDIEEMDTFYIDAFTAILAGKNKAMTDDLPKGK